ncbi:sigma-70 family RNA polymerase sigma factor [Algoriphagus aestuarii]|nr:sigma-70 family RNA polymerase sigma factor [Algoriphagus aestuarii]
MATFQNPSYFEQVFKDHWELMYQSAYRKIPDQNVVEDILQEIFIDIWQRRDSLEIKMSIKGYLMTAVKYQVMKHFDSVEKNRVVATSELPDLYQEEVMQFDELFEQIEMAMDALPPKSKLIFKMSRIEGYAVEEIAAKLNLSQQTVHNQISKSLKIMRGELKHLAPMLLLYLGN